MHLTQEKLAEKLNISRNSISEYENGHRQIGGIRYHQFLLLYQELMEKQDNDILRQFERLPLEYHVLFRNLFESLIKIFGM